MGDSVIENELQKGKPNVANKFLRPGVDGVIPSLNSSSSNSNESVSEQEIPYILTRKTLNPA